MDGNPKVSVIIPVYNTGRYLCECLDSVLGQTLKDIEVVCVDDGSTDSSPSILARYAAGDPRVRLLASPHAGAYRARETGLKVSRGEFIHFMDADDAIAAGALESLCAVADRENLDQVVFSSSVFCEDDVTPPLRRWAKRMERYYSVPKAVAGRVMPGRELMAALLDEGRFHVSPPLRIVRASILKEGDYPFPDATSRADNFFTPVSLYLSKRACAVCDRHYRRRVRMDSVTTGPDAAARHARNMYVVIDALCRFGPFREELADIDSTFSHFLALAGQELEKWLVAMPLDSRLRLLGELRDSLGPEACVSAQNALALALRGTRFRPKSLWSAAQKAARSAKALVTGRPSRKWSI